MYLARLCLNRSRAALGWVVQPYRVHQRLSMAYEGDPRLLFRIESAESGLQIIAQSHREPTWEAAFAGFPVLLSPPEHKPFSPAFSAGQLLAFRLRANPTAKKTFACGDGSHQKKRIGLYDEEQQIAWLQRKAEAGGFAVLRVQARQEGLVKGVIHRAAEPSSTEDAAAPQPMSLQMLAVTFDGLLRVTDPSRLVEILRAGIGSGKGLGFGLLSLARGSG